ncbi:hypothetical protein A2W24_02440 [Microgenomates group bacterium RBG_16_45_19]|nr:MAG: hypothetical protein A2W24_02440 [Microgenomates group bacterium RBG_16_45_19]
MKLIMTGFGKWWWRWGRLWLFHAFCPDLISLIFRVEVEPADRDEVRGTAKIGNTLEKPDTIISRAGRIKGVRPKPRAELIWKVAEPFSWIRRLKINIG